MTKKSDFPLVTLRDHRSECLSVLATVSLDNYLDLVEPAYRDQGGLAGQRAPIKTKTGMKIRERLVNDLVEGAIIPPVVVGAVCSDKLIKRVLALTSAPALLAELKNSNTEISIIDGMQRTTALLEAREREMRSQPIRIELWLAKKVDHLIYRMLVLNTGQVPWDLKRQLETLYKPIVAEIKAKLPDIQIIDLDDTGRRAEGGQYRSTRVIELFLAYTSRSTDIDVRERVTEEFAKIDITEATSANEFLPTFITSLGLMGRLDKSLDRLARDPTSSVAPRRGQQTTEQERIKAGRDIFTSSPAAIGFMVAIAEVIFGSPGFDYDMADAKKQLKEIEKRIEQVCSHMDGLSLSKLSKFVDFGTLNQRLNVKTSRIGEYERALFKSAFQLLFSKTAQVIKQGSLGPCWLSR